MSWSDTHLERRSFVQTIPWFSKWWCYTRHTSSRKQLFKESLKDLYSRDNLWYQCSSMLHLLCKTSDWVTMTKDVLPFVIKLSSTMQRLSLFDTFPVNWAETLGHSLQTPNEENIRWFEGKATWHTCRWCCHHQQLMTRWYNKKRFHEYITVLSMYHS